MGNFELVYIKWRDARGASSNWREIDEAAEDGICECESVGWVIKETAEFIQLGPHLGYDPDQVCGDMTIPKTAIIERIKINA